MKRLLILLLLIAPACFCQQTGSSYSNPLGGNVTAADAGTCSTQGTFFWQHLPTNANQTTVALSGTFSGTVTIRESNNGGATWTTAGTQSATGSATYSLNGFTDVCADVTTYASGNIGITITTGIQGASPGGSSSGSGITQVTTLPALPCTNNTLVQSTVTPFSIFNCIGGVWLQENANGTVLEQSYGVLADGIVINAGSQFTITSGSSNFTVTGGPGLKSSDVGKAIFATTWNGSDTTTGASCMTTASPTTIATVTSSTTGTLSQNATGNCGTTNSNIGVLFYGHDDTAARALAKAAAFDGPVCLLEYVPQGLSLQTTGQWNTSACPGTGVGTTASHYASIGGVAPGNLSVIVIPPWFTVSSCTGNADSVSTDCFGSAPASGFTNLSFNGLGDMSITWSSKHFLDTTTDSVFQNDIFELLGGGSGNTLGGIYVTGGTHAFSNVIIDQFGTLAPFTNNFVNTAATTLFVGNTPGPTPPITLNTGSVFQCYTCAYFAITGNGSWVNGTGTSVFYDYNGFYLNGNTSSSADVFMQGSSRAYLYGINATNTGNTASEVIATQSTAQAYLMAGSKVQGGATGNVFVCASTSTCMDDGTNIVTGTLGLAPTSTGTGFGTGTIALNTGQNSVERTFFTITPAGSPAATGTIVDTFNQTYAPNGQAPACELQLGNGTEAWTAPVTVLLAASGQSTTAYTWAWTAGGAPGTTGTLTGVITCRPR